jgi:hypothetical protein
VLCSNITMNILQSYILFISEILFIKTRENLVVKSVGLKVLNLLVSSSAANVDGSSFVSVLDVEFCNCFSNCWYL